MFKEIFLFDLKANLKRPSTWIFFTIFLIITALVTAAAGGLIGSSQGENNELFNSALNVSGLINAIVNNSLIGTIILVAIIAPAIQKDFQYNSHSIYFTKPISKFGYVMGRFLSAIITALVVLMACVLVFVIMCNLPIFDEGKIGHYGLWNYLQGFVYFIIPNTLFIGALFFSVVTYSRNMLAGYIGAIVLLVLTGIAGNLASDIDNKIIPSLIDPYGNTALNEITQYWSASEKNMLPIPFTGILLINRLLWLAISVVLFMVTYTGFSFNQTATTFTWFKIKKEKVITVINEGINKFQLPKVTTTFDTSLSWKLFTSLTKLEYKNLVKSPFFIIIAILSALTIFFNYTNGNDWYGTRLLPVTYSMAESLRNSMGLFGIIIIVFYAGVLVWRERDAKMDEIISATPIKNWVLLLSKIGSLTFMYATIVLLGIFISIVIQLSTGFTDIQLMVYIKSLFGYGMLGIIIIIALCVAVQAFVSNRYVGYFICIIILLLLPLILSKMGVQNDLIKFNSSGPSMPYSDMNGFGHQLYTFLLYKSYWLAFVSLLLISANLLWNRGKEKGILARITFAKNTISTKHYVGYAVALLTMIGFGGFIHYNTKVLNKYYTHDQEDENQAEYERKFKKYQYIAKLKITDIKVNLDIYPDTRSANVKGEYWLKNKGIHQVDTLFMSYSPATSNPLLTLSNNNKFTNLYTDTVNGIKILKFANPIAAGDSVHLTFAYNYVPIGFKNVDAGTAIVANGTFLNSGAIFPAISYDEDIEHDDKVKRAKYKLKPKERMHNVTETAYLNNNCVNRDADWVNYECTLSTAGDQTAISPGYLVKKWTTNNRNYFHYKMDKKILNFMSFQSARYEVKTSKWNDVIIEIYYDKHHPYNINSMLKACEKSLAYYSANYGAYQFKQLRIQEFPRYESFAQSFANTIPFSESIGFIAAPDLTKPDAIDYTYFVTAHEIAHQWWAHQVIGGNVKGATVVMESFAEYSALRVMEKEYGKKAMRKFLNYELKAYLSGRSNDNRDEDPLVYNQGQQHIHYQKGAMIMYGLSDLIGEQKMNDILKQYVSKVAFQNAPYTTALEFEQLVKTNTPDSLHYAIVDGFEKITLFENRTKDVSYTKLTNGTYKVKIIIDANKIYANGKGKKTFANMNDYIDIGIFAKGKTDVEPVELYNVKRKIKSGINTFEIIVSKQPYQAGIDPYNKLIDLDSDDNIRKVTDKKPIKKIDINENDKSINVNIAM
ncbi:MAG: ABC transporter permease, partial [Bacteroidia bacterium]|nr:ABC transporter permease [Bacteroidia bacterium]